MTVDRLTVTAFFFGSLLRSLSVFMQLLAGLDRVQSLGHELPFVLVISDEDRSAALRHAFTAITPSTGENSDHPGRMKWPGVSPPGAKVTGIDDHPAAGLLPVARRWIPSRVMRLRCC